MTHHYKTRGTCSRSIQFSLDEQHRIHDVQFEGGCNGNTQGVARLVEGLPADEVIDRLRGIRCGMRATSCPDQLATAIEQALQK